MENFLFNKKVLIAPLDWGLGHASRCIPLIQHLQKRGCKVLIASNGPQLSLLKKEFPNLEYIPLKGYNITYSRYKRWLGLKILWQIPKILLSVRHEHNWLDKIINQYEVELVLSDNRYGLYSKKVPCIIITHQLLIKAPFMWMEKIMQQINYRYLLKYNECWIPDFEGGNNIAGVLSHPSRLPDTNIKYIGPLSRFRHAAGAEIKYKYLFMLSGPEPQRSILEEKVLNIAQRLPGTVLIVRGLPGKENEIIPPATVLIKNHLTTAEMEWAFLASELIISRSGYTTVMELLSLGKKSILIPTPGQTEQEYLAQHLMKQGWCYSCKQDDDLFHHIQQAKKFNYTLPELETSNYEKIIDELLERL